jgi:hypothetical protein
MQIERPHDGDPRADHLPDSPDQIPFKIGGILRHGRTMQGEQHAVNGKRGS